MSKSHNSGNNQAFTAAYQADVIDKSQDKYVNLTRVDPGYKKIPIGTVAHPFPVLATHLVNGKISFAWQKIASDTSPLYIQSNREYGDAISVLMRNLPVRGMLTPLLKAMRNPLVNMISDPGYGKTFLAHMAGKVVHKEGVVEYIAAGRSMQNLIYETVFDSRRNKDFVQRIDQALEDGSLNALSLGQLRSLRTAEDKPLLIESGDTRLFDWKGLEQSGINTEEIKKVFDAVKLYQEWNGSMNIGFEDRPGKLIEAALSGRPLLIDEGPRRIPGTEGPMTVIWQVLNKERAECEVSLGNLGSFILRRGDIPMTIITSNRLKDGEDVHPFSDSLNSRLVNIEIPRFTKTDWQDRFEQLLTGMSISTLSLLESGRYSNDGEWVIANPHNFEANLKALRESDKSPVPHLQKVYLDNWQAVREAAAKLGDAYFQIEQLLDPESGLMQSQNLGGVKLEVTQPGDPVKPLTPRKPQHQIMEVSQIGYTLSDLGSGRPDFTNLRQPVLKALVEKVEENFGARLKQSILDWVVDVCGVTVDATARPKLFEHMLKILTETQVLSDVSVLDKLNIKEVIVNKTVASDEVLQAADIINSALKKKYPDSEGIPVEEIESFLETAKIAKTQITSDKFSWSTIPEDVAEQLVLTNVQSRIALPNHEEKFIKQNPANSLIEEERLLTSLVLPYISKNALASLFLYKSDIANDDVEGLIAVNKHDKLATTTVVCQNNGNYCPVHIVVNKADDKILVVRSGNKEGTQVTKGLVDRLASKGITYVSQKDAKAKSVIDKWLQQNTKREDLGKLAKAFQIRNFVNEEKAGIAELLSQPELSQPDNVVVMSALKNHGVGR